MKYGYALIASTVAALFLSIASPVHAQPGPGMGPGYGSGQGYGQGQGRGGMGMGNYGRGRGFAFNNTNTRGWSLMTAEERVAHRDKMWSAKSYNECKAIQDENHQAMTERAKVQGKTLPTPRWNGCDRMKARGFFN